MMKVIRCNFCQSNFFNSYRYRCLVCDDLDLCSFCFESHTELQGHKLFHPMVKLDSFENFCGLKIEDKFDGKMNFFQEKLKNYTHKEKCKACCTIIKGVKLKCDICFAYRLCLNCFKGKKNTENHNHDKHPMVIFSDSLIDFDKNKLPTYDPVKDFLGSGGFSDVYKAKYESQYFALKVTKSSQNESRNINFLKSYLRELTSYNEIDGENILRMIGNYTQNDRYYIGIEYMKKGCLKDVIAKDKNFGLYEKFKITFGIICGINRIHLKKIVHKDIRPDNILVDENYTPKIADFGIAKVVDKYHYFNPTACIDYMPPEFYIYPSLKDEPTFDKLSKIDIFTYGLTVLEIFDGKHGAQFPDKDFSTRNPVVIKKDSKNFKSLISKCITNSVEDRPTSKHILDYLKTLHDFFQHLRNGEIKDFDSIYSDSRDKIVNESFALFETDFTI